MQNPYDAYKTNAVFTASKEELTLMLYDGALKFCNQAQAALERKDYEKANEFMQKAQNIIKEFQATLNHKYEISAQLHAVYEYLYLRLLEANIKKNSEALIEVRDHIRTLRDTWKEAMKIARMSVPATRRGGA